MNIITLDFETYFDADYTLSKLSTEEYIRDPRFKAHTVGVKFGDQPAVDFLPHLLHENADLRRHIETSAVLCHHSHFDGFILSHHYGLRPAFWLDTLSMARATVRDVTVGGSLDKLAKFFGLPAKSVPYNLFKGIRDLPEDIYKQVAEGCKHDVELTYQIFKRLMKGDF